MCLLYMTYSMMLFKTRVKGVDLRGLALRLELLSSQVQKLSRERDASQLTRDHLTVLQQRFQHLNLTAIAFWVWRYSVDTYGFLFPFCSLALDRSAKAWFNWWRESSRECHRGWMSSAVTTTITITLTRRHHTDHTQVKLTSLPRARLSCVI